MSSGTYELAQAPIVRGSERCVRLISGASVARPEGLPIESDNITFTVDTQLEALGRHPVIRLTCGSRAWMVDLERSGEDVVFHGWHRTGRRWHYGSGALSRAAGRRLVIRFNDARSIGLDEIQPWGELGTRDVPLRGAAGPVVNWTGYRVGGHDANGSAYSGRVAEVGVFARYLDNSEVEDLRAATLHESVGSPSMRAGTLTAEGRKLFLADYQLMQRWLRSDSLAMSEVRQAANIAHIWLLDRVPLLQRVSDHFGALLSLPDLKRAAARDSVLRAEPALWWPEGGPEGDWMPLSAFRQDLACWLGSSGQDVSWTAFVKFIRNKLGGSHYDPEDRTRWQTELDELARETTRGGEAWLAEMMLTLVRCLVVSVHGCGFDRLALDADHMR